MNNKMPVHELGWRDAQKLARVEEGYLNYIQDHKFKYESALVISGDFTRLKMYERDISLLISGDLDKPLGYARVRWHNFMPHEKDSSLASFIIEEYSPPINSLRLFNRKNNHLPISDLPNDLSSTHGSLACIETWQSFSDKDKTKIGINLIDHLKQKANAIVASTTEDNGSIFRSQGFIAWKPYCEISRNIRLDSESDFSVLVWVPKEMGRL